MYAWAASQLRVIHVLASMDKARDHGRTDVVPSHLLCICSRISAPMLVLIAGVGHICNCRIRKGLAPGLPSCSKPRCQACGVPQRPLQELIVGNPDFVRPSSRRNEVLGWVKTGIRDFSISRAAVAWGVPIPQDPKQTVYVWFDALTGYLSGDTHSWACSSPSAGLLRCCPLIICSPPAGSSGLPHCGRPRPHCEGCLMVPACMLCRADA